MLPLGEIVRAGRDEGYVPDFKLAFQHFLIHTGGRAVIEARPTGALRCLARAWVSLAHARQCSPVFSCRGHPGLIAGLSLLCRTQSPLKPCAQEVEKRLQLTHDQVAPSKATLRRFGNTCCAAIFYVLTRVEATVRVLMLQHACVRAGVVDPAQLLQQWPAAYSVGAQRRAVWQQGGSRAHMHTRTRTCAI